MAIETVMGQSLLIMGTAITGLCLSRLPRLDMPLACLLAGIGAGWFVPYAGLDTGIRADNLQSLIFFVMLPVLIFQASWKLQPDVLKHWLKVILTLAIPGVIVGCLVTAILVYIAIGHSEGFPWIAALLTGAILSATDPQAILNKLKQINAPKDLRTLLEGESLFSDASTIVLFSLLIGLATTGSTNSHVLVDFLADFFGGFFVGAVLGLIAAIVVLLIAQRAGTQIVLLFTAFASYYIAEQLLRASGVMSVMGAAMVSRYCLRDHQDFVDSLEENWQWLGLLASSVVFSLMGLVITPDMFSDQWLAMLIAIAAGLLSRTSTVLSSAALSRRSGYHIPKAWQPTMIWGGLRGAIAIALVLSLPVSLPYWWTIQSMVFAVVLFNLIVQAGTSHWVLKRF